MLFTNFMRDFMFPDFKDFFGEVNRVALDAEGERKNCYDCDRSCSVCNVPDDEDVASLFSDEHYNVHPVTTTSENGFWILNQDESKYYLIVQMPEIDKENMDIEVEDNSVKVEYAWEESVNKEHYASTRKSTGAFRYSIPKDADATTLIAHYDRDNAQLELTVKKLILGKTDSWKVKID